MDPTDKQCKRKKASVSMIPTKRSSQVAFPPPARSVARGSGRGTTISPRYNNAEGSNAFRFTAPATKESVLQHNANGTRRQRRSPLQSDASATVAPKRRKLDPPADRTWDMVSASYTHVPVPYDDDDDDDDEAEDKDDESQDSSPGRSCMVM